MHKNNDCYNFRRKKNFFFARLDLYYCVNEQAHEWTKEFVCEHDVYFDVESKVRATKFCHTLCVFVFVYVKFQSEFILKN